MEREPADGPGRVVVVGGGVSGLATAFFLRESGCDDVTVLEAEPVAGGKVRTRLVHGLPVDTGPDAFLARAPELRSLVEALDLSGAVTGPSASGAYVWSRGKLRRLPAGGLFGIPDRVVPLVRSRLLSPWGTLRAGADLVRPRTALPADPSVGELVRPRFGAEVFERLVEPLLGGVHAGRADELSARSSVPEVAALAGNGGSIVRALRRRRRSIPTPAPGAPSAPPLVTLDGGLGRLVDALTGRLAGRVVTAAAVESVRRAGPSWVVRTADAEFAADVVVLATPAHASARLLAQVAPGAAAILDEIPYVDVATITLAYAREDVPSLPTDGTGVLVPPVEGSLLVGCTWLSSKWPYLRNDDVVLLRCLVGRRGDDRFTLLADDALVAAVRVELTRMLGISAIPLEQHVQRWPAAMPQYVVGHADRLERLDAVLTELPGLLLTGAAYRGLGLAGCVAQASTTATVARRLLDAFPTSNPLETTPGPGTKE